jgi:hypothetical protein
VLLKSWIKRSLRLIRDKSFWVIEILLVSLFKLIPKTSGKEERIVFFSPRAGRGLKSSEVDDVFFRTYPITKLEATEILCYNSRFWIIDTLKLLIQQRSTKNQKVILIQYVEGFHVCPSVDLLEYLQSQGAIIEKIWLDSYSDSLWDNRINKIAHLGSLNVVIDTPNLKEHKFIEGNTYCYKPVPLASTPNIPFSTRENFVYYSGGVENEGLYKPRKIVIDFLNEHNFHVKGTAYDRNKPIQRPDYNTYRNQLSNSLIGLNFTWKGDEDVLVTRTWEILSSTVLLLQNKSGVLSGLLEPGIHYLEFSSNQELLEILHDLQNNPDKISEIALAGKRRYEELFSAEIFWKLVLQ